MNAICPHCKIGRFREPAGIETHQISRYINRRAGDDRQFQKQLDDSGFTRWYNSYSLEHGSAPTWREQLNYIARKAGSFAKIPFNKVDGNFTEHTDCMKIIVSIHEELKIQNNVIEFINWAANYNGTKSPFTQIKTSIPCDICGYDEQGDFTKWETIEDCHFPPDYGSEEREIRFAAMIEYCKNGYGSMIEKFWFAQDLFEESGRLDWKCLRLQNGQLINFEEHNSHRRDRFSTRFIRLGLEQIKSVVIKESIYNYHWFMGIPPGRLFLQSGKHSSGIDLLISSTHIQENAMARYSFLPDIRMKPEGIYHYFEASD